MGCTEKQMNRVLVNYGMMLKLNIYFDLWNFTTKVLVDDWNKQNVINNLGTQKYKVKPFKYRI